MVFRQTPWYDPSTRSEVEQRFFEWFDRSQLLFMGSACDLRCRYCFRIFDNESFSPIELLEQQMKAARANGAKRIILTGGEPLIHPKLDKALEHINELGFEGFGVQTNGTRMTEPSFVESLHKRGLRYCHISYDTPDRDTLEEMTGSKKLYDQLYAAFENISPYPDVTLTIKAVITTLNARHIPAFIEAMHELKERFGLTPVLTLTPMVPPESRYNPLVPRYESLVDAIFDGIAAAKEVGLRALYHHVPYCVMRGRVHDSVDYHTRDGFLDEEGVFSENDLYDKNAGCERCDLKDKCPGFPTSYALLYGDREFQPVGQDAEPAPRQPVRPVRAENSDWSSDIRIVLGSLRKAGTEYFSYKSIIDLIPRIAGPGSSRIILTGPEPLQHPALPQLVGHLAESGFEVWIETLALGLHRIQTLEILQEHGLAGVRWLHLHTSAPPYLAMLGKPLSGGLVNRTGEVLEKAGVEVEHVFPTGDEPVNTVLRRVRAVSKLPFQKGRRPRYTLSCLPALEKWSTWLGIEHPGEPRWSHGLKEIPGIFIEERQAQRVYFEDRE